MKNTEKGTFQVGFPNGKSDFMDIVTFPLINSGDTSRMYLEVHPLS